MKKQTAVDFLKKEMIVRLPQFYAHLIMDMDSVYDKAIEMEKEQIINAYEDGHVMGLHKLENTGKQHYNETYQTK
jgi:uncharacterized membrane-anchored protein